MPFAQAWRAAPDRARPTASTAESRQPAESPRTPAAWVALASRATAQKPPLAARARVEDATGADLRDARVRVGDAVDAAASALQADAFTVGRDVHVASDAYRPGTPSGDRLLAHELTHVAQQRSADAYDASLAMRPADEPAEQTADAVAGGASFQNGVEQIAPAVQRLVSEKQTRGTDLDVAELTKWAGMDYWTQKILQVYAASMPSARFKADTEERDAVLSAAWHEHQQIRKLSSKTVRLITLPKRGSGTKELAYRLEFAPAQAGAKDARPTLDITFIAEGPAAVTATTATPATAPSWPSSWTEFDFPTGTNLQAYAKQHPDEVDQLLAFIETTPPDKSFEQLLETTSAKPAHTTTFLVSGSKDASGDVSSLKIRLVGQQAPAAGTVAAGHAQHDFADLQIEKLQAGKSDALGTISGLSSVPADERLAVKFAVWQYFSAGKTRNAEVDAIVPLPDGKRRILYTFTFEPKTNDVSVKRIGEEGKGAAVLDPGSRRLDLQRVQGFDPAFATDAGKLKTWLGKRYPAITPSGADAPAILADANTKLNASAGTDTWLPGNYKMPVLDATAGEKRLQTAHGLDAAQTADMKTFQPSELKLVEWALQTLSDAILAIVRGVTFVRQKVKMAKSSKPSGRRGVPPTVTYTPEPKTSGESFVTGAERTVALYDNLTINDKNLFIGQATTGGDARVAPLSAMTIVHELGHQVGWGGTPKTVRDEFNAKFANARSKLNAAPVTWYAKSQPSTEFFPEAFAIYNLDPEWMRTNLPDMATWFDTLATSGTTP